MIHETLEFLLIMTIPIGSEPPILFRASQSHPSFKTPQAAIDTVLEATG